MADRADLERKEISDAVVRRLPVYYRCLGDLVREGIEKVSSRELSERLRLTASQIRQDLNRFGGFGQQGYGYNVQNLHTEIGRILGLDRHHSFIIIGAGHLGQALANYSPFEDIGFYAEALFDVKADLVGKNIRGIPILSMSRLEEFISARQIRIAALTLPARAADAAARRLMNAGIVGLWNFSLADLHLPKEVVTESVHLSESLMRMSYRLCEAENEKGGTGCSDC